MGPGEDADRAPTSYLLTVTASDAAGPAATAQVTITIVDEEDAVTRARLTQANAAVTPAVARAVTVSTLEAVTGRIAEAAAAGAAAGGRLSLAGQPDPYQALRAHYGALEAGTFGVREAVTGSSFVLPLSRVAGAGAGAPLDGDALPGAGPSGAGRTDAGGRPTGLASLAVWGGGDYRALAGGTVFDAVRWNGNVISAYGGADLRPHRNVLTGLALSLAWSEGDFEHRAGTGGTAQEGTYRSQMTSLHPYLGWDLNDVMSVWAAAGHGRGSIELADRETGRHESATSLWSVAAGGSGALLGAGASFAGGQPEVRLKTEAWFAWYEVAGKGLIERSNGESSRLRLLLEGSNAWTLGAAGSLTPSLEVGVRHDGGGAAGSGVEFGGGLRYAHAAAGLTVAGRGRGLLAYGGDYQEWGVSGLVRLDPGSGGRGPSLSVAPAWGETESGTERLWQQGLPASTADAGARQSRLEATLGYGLPGLGGIGLLTPYTGLTLSPEGARRYVLGGRFEVGSSLRLSLEGERREAHGSTPGHGVTLQGRINY